MLDANEDLSTHNKCTEMFTTAGLHEVIQFRHPYLPAPTTHDPGTKTIDGIFCTPMIKINAAVYSPFMGFTSH